MSVQVSDATITINNNVVAIVPNSCAFTEGFGEQDMKAASAGGGQIDPVYSNNVETNLSMLKFELFATIENIALAREWKANANANLAQLAGRTSEGSITRTFSQAALLGDYEVGLGSDTTIPIEFKSKPAV